VALGLAEQLAARLGGEVADLSRMVGGASRETWSLTLDGRPLVFRCDPPGALRAGGMPREAALLRAAGAAGVPVPEVVDVDDDSIVMSRLDGETIARRILRDDAYATTRSRLPAQLAHAAAALHQGVAVDAVPDLAADADPLATLRDMLDGFGEPHPAFELGLRRLADQRPEPVGQTVVHGDFRLGNIVVDGDGLLGVLDWELAHVGDPVEDLGWMCVRSWRFGGRLPVAGLGTREQLLSDYAAAGGAEVEPESLWWWEAYGTLRWGVICVQQAATHLTGAVRSVELAAIGRRVCEVELDLLDMLLGPGDVVAEAAPAQQSGPHDRPTAVELLDAAKEWIAGLPLAGRDAFLARVSGRALEIVQREIELGPALAERHRQRLRDVGFDSDAELAAAIRGGADTKELEDVVRSAVVDKLLVADPRQLTGR